MTIKTSVKARAAMASLTWVVSASCLLATACQVPGADDDSAAETATESPAAQGLVATVPQSPLASPASATPRAAPGQVLIKLASTEDADELAQRRVGLSGALQHRRSPLLQQAFERFTVRDAVRAFGGLPLPELRRVFKLTSDTADVDTLVARLRATPGVVYAEPNRINHVLYAPNDPFYATSGSWGQPYADLWGIAKIAAPTAWSSTLGTGVTVAVIDTGVDYGHPDIAANIWQNPGEVGTDAMGRDKRSNGVDDDANGFVDDWHGYNFASASTLADNDPMDDYGHGTHAAGTIAAVGNNGAGIVGIAPAAKIMALKALDASGNGTDADLAAAIYYAARNGAKVINASWGVMTDTKDQTVTDAVNYAHDTYGVVFVASAGNTNRDIGSEALSLPLTTYPAAALNAVAVGATTHLDTKSPFSNYGVKLDVTAPGGGDTDSGVIFPSNSILSLLSSQGSGLTSGGLLAVGGQYLRLAGTSMSAPHVSGVVALIRAAHPTFTAEQVRAALRAGTDDLAPTGWDQQSGYGRLNAGKAVALASPLSAHLSGPTSLPSGASQVAITGNAAGTGFTQYKVEYGATLAPTSWTTITTSTTAVTSGTLATWNLATVPDGLFTIRLTSTATGGKTYQDRLPFSLQSVSIDTPINEQDDQYRPGTSIQLMGTVTTPGLNHYAVTITGAVTGAVAQSTITLAGGGTQQVTHGLLATWNTTGLPTDHYTITLTVTSGITRTVQTHVTLDSTLHQGWPWRFQNVVSEFPRPIEPWFGMTAADLNGDGTAEVLHAQGQYVYALRGDGTVLPGWPQQLANEDDEHSIAPVFGDITGDGVPEVLASSCNDGRLYAWTRAGAPLPGWPAPSYFQGGGCSALTLADMNHDGIKDVIETGYTSNYITVVDSHGTVLPGWPANTMGGLGRPAVGDVDGDGQPEIVVPTVSGTDVFVYRADGVMRAGWPKTLGPTDADFAHYSWPALADLDGDGKLDIIVGATNGKVYAWHGDGTSVTGWPKSTVLAEINTPAVGDIDGDGAPEVVVGTGSLTESGATVEYLYAWHANGTALAGWPVRYAPAGTVTTEGGFHAPALADVDGDGKADVVVSSDVGTPAYGLHAYRYTATEAATFPKPTPNPGSWVGNAPAIADFDGDGLLEVVWDSHFANNSYGRSLTQLTMWDLAAPKTAPQPWPMFAHDTLKTGVYTPPTATLVALARTGWTATASSNPSGTPVTAALDGSASTRWATGTNQVSGQYYLLDMKTSQAFSQLVLDSTGSTGNYPAGYQVFVSSDGTNFGSAIATGAGSGNLTTITFAPQTARYIKIVQTGSLAHWWSIYELNVYGSGGTTTPPPGPLPRAGWVTTASNNASTTGNALDGVATTRWTTGTAQTTAAWYQVDMLTPQTFNQLTLDSAGSTNDYPRGYAVYVSADGVNFGSPIASGAGTNKLVTINFNNQTARYLKIRLTAAVSNWWSIAELNVLH